MWFPTVRMETPSCSLIARWTAARRHQRDLLLSPSEGREASRPTNVSSIGVSRDRRPPTARRLGSTPHAAAPQAFRGRNPRRGSARFGCEQRHRDRDERVCNESQTVEVGVGQRQRVACHRRDDRAFGLPRGASHERSHEAGRGSEPQGIVEHEDADGGITTIDDGSAVARARATASVRFPAAASAQARPSPMSASMLRITAGCTLSNSATAARAPLASPVAPHACANEARHQPSIPPGSRRRGTAAASRNVGSAIPSRPSARADRPRRNTQMQRNGSSTRRSASSSTPRAPDRSQEGGPRRAHR